MSKLIMAAAQTSPKFEDIAGNLQDHYRLVGLAAENGARLIVFPEMSLTGYVRESAEKLSFAENDSRLDKLRGLASDFNMTVIAGAPVKIGSALYIGSFVILPDHSVTIYTKQFLHTGEEVFFKPSFSHNPVIELENERISLAICADINNPIHAENASKSNCTIYMASIFFTPGGIAEAYDLLSGYAKKHSLVILMANYCGRSWGLEAAGKSALWSKKGGYAAGLDTGSTGLVIGQKNGDSWNGFIIKE